MNYPEIIINGIPIKLIPLGDCACGCGGKTTIAKQSVTKKGLVNGQPLKFINHHHSRVMYPPNWKGGKSIQCGYPVTLNKDETKPWRYTYDHVILAEKALGKPMPAKTVVHHHTPDQLVICENQAYHLLLHQRARAFYTCGNANWRKCVICKQYDEQKNLYTNNGRFFHTKCSTEARRQWNIKNKTKK